MKKIHYFIILSFVICAVIAALLLSNSFASSSVTVNQNYSPTPTITPTPIASPIATSTPTVTPEPTKSPQPLETPKMDLVPYKGVVEHIFFHPLLAYPEQAFDGDSQSLGFDDWFVTVDEFNKILKSLYEKNFILVNINDVYEEYEKDGILLLRKKELMLPKGKKPLIISLDDVNYNEYMLGNGTVYKLILDEKGEITTYSKNPKGEDIYSKDLESITILDQFVNNHPDFSHNGAKGTIALTGYEGVLGYRTNRQSPNKDTEIEKAKPVIEKLKSNGWNFASHSYGHPDVAKISLEKLKDDSSKWKNEVETLIGSTQVYIYPFGSAPKEGTPNFEYLRSLGYKIFCAVGIESYENISTHSNVVMTDRRHVDGMGFRRLKDKNIDLFDANLVMDTQIRPKR